MCNINKYNNEWNIIITYSRDDSYNTSVERLFNTRFVEEKLIKIIILLTNESVTYSSRIVEFKRDQYSKSRKSACRQNNMFINVPRKRRGFYAANVMSS